MRIRSEKVAIKDIKLRYAVRMIVYIHDYFCLCPSCNLIDNNFTYCGICDPIDINCIKSNNNISQLYRTIDHVLWRELWFGLLNVAEQIICFSESSKNILLSVYNKLDSDKVLNRPHNAVYIRKAIMEKKGDNPFIIGVPGTITEIKGSLIIRDILKIIDEKKLNIKIIGQLSLSF
jgi:glycosyltransferase involved in cell wall biosynthesis